MTETRKLRVFLCHASQDKPIVRELYQRLLYEGWIDPWLDEEKLLPGQDWDMEIEKAVEVADAVIVFLSSNSVSKQGYVQKEIRMVLDVSDKKPEGVIFIIPVRLDSHAPPARLSRWQYRDYFPEALKDRSYIEIISSLTLIFKKLGIPIDPQKTGKLGATIRSFNPKENIEVILPTPNSSSFILKKPCFITQSGEVIQLPREKEMITVGREDTSIVNKPDIILSERSVSRLHATIYFRNGDYFLQSLITATNGTFVNGELLQKEMKLINNNDLIELGSIKLIFYK